MFTRPSLDVKNDTVLKRILEKIRRLSRKIRSDEHTVSMRNQTASKTTTSTSSTPKKGIAVSKEARRIDEKVRQMRCKDQSTDHKVAVGRADYISFTQYGPVGKLAISDLAILLLCDWTSMGWFDPELIESLRRVGRVVLIRWPFDKGSPRNESTSGVFTETFSYPLLVSAAVRVIRSLRRFKNINVFVPFSQSHAGWIGIRLLRSLPCVLPGIVFSNWNLEQRKEHVFENEKISREISRSYRIFESPLKVMMSLGGHISALNVSVSPQENKVSPQENEQKEEENDDFDVVSYEWLSRARYSNKKELGEKVCAFIRALRLPPPPPCKPTWNAKSCIMSWTLSKSRRRGDDDEDLIHSLHFFLVPQVEDIQIQSVAEDELDAAIDEGRPNRSMKYLISRGLVSSVAMYGAALLVSAPVVLTVTALYVL